MITRESLVEDLKSIGIKAGDMLLVKASYRSVGKVEGGPKTLVDAILDVVGSEGTVVTVAFAPRVVSWKRYFVKNKYTYTKKSPTYTGAFNTAFIKYPNALRSENPLQPYAAIGKYAKELIDNYKIDSPPYELLKIMSEKYHAKNLQIGGNVIGVGTTHISLRDAMRENGYYQRLPKGGIYYMLDNGKRKWMESNESIFCAVGHRNLYPYYISEGGILAQGKIGNADSLVSDMYTTLQIERKLFNENIGIILCNDPLCLKCRLSFPFSNGKYIDMIRNILKVKGVKIKLVYFESLFKYIFFSKKNRQ